MNVARPFVNPGTLFFAHGDGNLGDVGNCNFYFNYVPLQEREEWYSHWAEHGEIPCYPAEFGAPYYGVWFGWVHKTPQMTEWLAKVYGDQAYADEEDDLLARYLEFARDCAKHTHGGWVKPGRKSLYDFSPLGREFNGLLIDRVSRCWRTFGQGPSPMYLDSWCSAASSRPTSSCRLNAGSRPASSASRSPTSSSRATTASASRPSRALARRAGRSGLKLPK